LAEGDDNRRWRLLESLALMFAKPFNIDSSPDTLSNDDHTEQSEEHSGRAILEDQLQSARGRLKVPGDSVDSADKEQVPHGAE
jgi:hypothetical protein